MNTRIASTESEQLERRRLVCVVSRMLAGGLPFLEGAVQVAAMRDGVGGVSTFDDDFKVFTAIVSETDHLPLAAQEHLWNPESLRRLHLEREKSEAWARSIALGACSSLIERFKDTQLRV